MIMQKITYILLFTLMIGASAFSQTRSRTTIVENVNATKAGLVHVLNRTGDTIILKSSTPIFRFSFLFHTQKESVLMDLDSKEAKIPLHHFEVGRYTVVAYREDAVYPISLNRVEVINKPADAIADLEEDILRASLSKDEQRKRNIKPRVAPERDTRLAEVTSKQNRAETEAKEREQRELIKRQADDAAKRERALAEAEAEKQRALIKKEAEEKAKKEHALAEANRVRAEKEKAERQLAQIEANRKAIKEREIAEARNQELRAIAEAERKASNKTVADNTSSRPNSEIDKKSIKYNISIINDDSVDKQTREDYRKQNLRPNGKAYDE